MPSWIRQHRSVFRPLSSGQSTSVLSWAPASCWPFRCCSRP